MPKNPKLNIDRYKIAGGELNQYEFQQNQQAFADQQQESDVLIPGTPPEATEPQQSSKVEELVAGITDRRAAKAGKKSPAKRSSRTIKKAAKTTKKSAKKSRQAAKSSKAERASKRSASKSTKKSAKAQRSTKRRATKKAGKRPATKRKSRK